MRDRLPQPGKEGRVKLTNVTIDPDGTINGKLDFDDGATQTGSIWSRGNVLPDDLCIILNIDPAESELKDALLALRSHSKTRQSRPTTFQSMMTGGFK